MRKLVIIGLVLGLMVSAGEKKPKFEERVSQLEVRITDLEARHAEDDETLQILWERTLDLNERLMRVEGQNIARARVR